MRFAAFDVETPNSANDRMSSIGVTILEDGIIRDQFYSLVNPQCRFDSFNISLTGITPYMAVRSPTFPDVWERLRPFLDHTVLVAHNAPFDLSVLGKCLRDYGIFWKRETPYICTCQMGRRLLPQLSDHRLNTMAAYYSVPLRHHNAGSDAEVCAKLLKHYLDSGADLSAFLRKYDLIGLFTSAGEGEKAYPAKCSGDVDHTEA